MFAVLSLACLALAGASALAGAEGSPWKRHVIDDSFQGADGVRLADVNGDGLPDLVVPWEESGVVRVYLNPGPARARERWPAVTVGRVASPEDAVFADLDGDGAVDVITSCEGKERTIYVHRAPKAPGEYLNPEAWRTEPLPASRNVMQWMFAAPLRLAGSRLLHFAAGGKNVGAKIGWFEAPPNPRNLARWAWNPLDDAGWVMSLEAIDMDGDGHADLLASDRYGASRGVFWLQNPGAGQERKRPWRRHPIGGEGVGVMFLDTFDLNGDGLTDVITAAKPRQVFFHRRLNAAGDSWKTYVIRIPERAGTAKGVRVGDINLDGKPNIVFSCEHASEGRSGVMWMAYSESPTEPEWKAYDISGPEGVKYDLVQLIDLDGDGDLDVLTCEETDNLGVVWYENPAR